MCVCVCRGRVGEEGEIDDRGREEVKKGEREERKEGKEMTVNLNGPEIYTSEREECREGRRRGGDR